MHSVFIAQGPRRQNRVLRADGDRRVNSESGEAVMGSSNLSTTRFRGTCPYLPACTEYTVSICREEVAGEHQPPRPRSPRVRLLASSGWCVTVFVWCLCGCM
ncbi:hypothetical protein LZ31DRAFT_145504 [Colletotrichum somersetense]|nr:hypothetical protein LZ31DRAFT_145504 [Colletotrichum somersetense]